MLYLLLKEIGLHECSKDGGGNYALSITSPDTDTDITTAAIMCPTCITSCAFSIRDTTRPMDLY